MFIETDAKNPNYKERAATLFQPDTLIAAQYSGTFRRKLYLQPEKRLMLAILEDAIFCFKKYVMSRDRKGKTLFRDAEDWILDTDTDYIFSFGNICDTLSLDSSYLCGGLLRWKESRLRA